MYCKKCGFKIKTDMKTCPNCGETVDYSEYCSGFYGILGAGEAKTGKLQEDNRPEVSKASPAAGTSGNPSPVPGNVRNAKEYPGSGAAPEKSPKQARPEPGKTAPGKAAPEKDASGKQFSGGLLAVIALVLACLCLTLLIIQMFRISALKKQIEDLSKNTGKTENVVSESEPASVPASTEVTVTETPEKTETPEETTTEAPESAAEFTDEATQESEVRPISDQTAGIEGPSDGEPEYTETESENSADWGGQQETPEGESTDSENPLTPEGESTGPENSLKTETDFDYEMYYCDGNSEDLAIYLLTYSQTAYNYHFEKIETSEDHQVWDDITTSISFDDSEKIKEIIREEKGLGETELYISVHKLKLNREIYDISNFNLGTIIANPYNGELSSKEKELGELRERDISGEKLNSLIKTTIYDDSIKAMRYLIKDALKLQTGGGEPAPGYDAT